MFQRNSFEPCWKPSQIIELNSSRGLETRRLLPPASRAAYKSKRLCRCKRVNPSSLFDPTGNVRQPELLSRQSTLSAELEERAHSPYRNSNESGASLRVRARAAAGSVSSLRRWDRVGNKQIQMSCKQNILIFIFLYS